MGNDTVTPTASELVPRWLAQAARLEREANDMRSVALRDEDAGRYDMAARNRRAAADCDTRARVLRECAKELDR